MVDLACIKGNWATGWATAENKVASCEQCDASARIGMEITPTVHDGVVGMIRTRC